MKGSRSVALCAVFAMALSGSILAYEPAWSFAQDHAKAIIPVRKVLDPLLAFMQRSPGSRSPGELIQSKKAAAKLPGSRAMPHEQVLANVRYATPGMDSVDDATPNPDSSFFEPVAFSGSSDTSLPAIFPQSAYTNSESGIGIGGGGGGIAGGGGGGGGDAGTIVAIPAIPEPATWSMLLLGIFLIGRNLRTPSPRYKVS
jgi:hypothetical protein